MTTKEEIKLSKMLSKALRHDPKSLDIEIDEAGWTNTEILINKVSLEHQGFGFEDLSIIVQNNDKKRFEFNADGQLIRASQGHSVTVDLQYEECSPPDILYHGTSTDTVQLLFADGIKKMSRHHVHLSSDVTTAHKVGQRHGKPAILVVNASAMHNAGYKFYHSTNGVWLTEFIPTEYISRHSQE